MPKDYPPVDHGELPPKADIALHQSQDLVREINLLSGRVEIQMRLLARIIAKMDPAFIEDPQDPEVRRRSLLLERATIEKMKQEAYAQQANDSKALARLQRYFKDMP